MSKTIEQPDLTAAAEQTAPDELPITFSKTNTDAIRKMVGSYGKSDNYVVFTAISLLYSIFRQTKTCESLVLYDRAGKSYSINMPIVE